MINIELNLPTEMSIIRGISGCCISTRSSQDEDIIIRFYFLYIIRYAHNESLMAFLLIQVRTLSITFKQIIDRRFHYGITCIPKKCIEIVTFIKCICSNK